MNFPVTGATPAPSDTIEQIFADMRRDAQLWAEFADKVDAIIAEKQAERAAFSRSSL